jgi:two-component system, NtrC family, sensor kinase
MALSSVDPVGPEGASPRRARILLVDDEPVLLRGLKRALSDHEVLTASNVAQGMDLYRLHDFDIVFCDLMMPESTGLEFYERLRDLGPEHAARLVLMTGGVFFERLGCSLSQIPTPCILKPFRDGELELLIDQALDRGR